MYRIYKSDINTYRVLNTKTGKFEVENVRFLTIDNPKFRVNQKGYNLAKVNSFKNSGNKLDYFACIECKSYQIGAQFICPNRVKFNPFRFNFFFDNQTFKPIKFSKVVVLLGNELYYN